MTGARHCMAMNRIMVIVKKDKHNVLFPKRLFIIFLACVE